jgi:hypothetical protein
MKKKENGQTWIDTHIHTFMAVSAPWLGMPRTIRSLVTGDNTGHGTLLEENEGLHFARSIGSLLCFLFVSIF